MDVVVLRVKQSVLELAICLFIMLVLNLSSDTNAKQSLTVHWKIVFQGKFAIKISRLSMGIRASLIISVIVNHFYIYCRIFVIV